MRDVVVSVLIPTHRRPVAVKKCLEALALSIQAAEGVSCEILIGNDGDAGDLEEIPEAIAGAPVVIVPGPKKGPAWNRNRLAANAKGRLLVYLDDDVIPSVSLIPAYAKAAQANPDAGLFEGRIVKDRDARFAYEEVLENESGGFLWSANIAIRAGVLAELGGFDTDFPFAAMEDVDFHLRVQEKHIPVIWCPEAAVMHPVEVRIGRLLLSKHRYSCLLFIQKHPDELGKLKSEYTLAQCLRTIKYRVARRSWIQPWKSYVMVLERIRAILLLRRILHNSATIPNELVKLRQELGMPG